MSIPPDRMEIKCIKKCCWAVMAQVRASDAARVSYMDAPCAAPSLIDILDNHNVSIREFRALSDRGVGCLCDECVVSRVFEALE